jgi:hypothetical protein
VIFWQPLIFIFQLYKRYYLLLLFVFCHSWAQNSIGNPPTKKTALSVFSDKDIKTDSLTVAVHTFDKNFKKRYTDPDFVYEYKAAAKNAWDRFLDWLGDLIDSLFRFSTNGVSGTVVGIIFKIVMFGIIAFAIYLIVKSILNKEGQWIFGKNSNKTMLQYNEIERNLHLIDFDKLIANCLNNNENRLAVRYYYLYLLKKMSAAGLIVWDIEKTNSDYIFEIKNQERKSQFEYLSYLYNNIWYGEFELDQPTFDKAKTAFETALKNIANG